MQYFLRYGFMVAFCAGLAAGCEGPENPQKKQIPPENFPSTGAPASAPKKEGKMITTASGLKYQDQEEGSGAEAKSGDRVEVHYSGYLTDGTRFDSSLTRGQPFGLTLGMGKVIKGWDEGIVGMKVGGRRRLIIPPNLGYGEKGFPPVIPPKAELTFDVQMLKIN
jgi:FKBP-type peptidyl-prolyl cis-trans isomerase